jgi:hypothetical protein
MGLMAEDFMVDTRKRVAVDPGEQHAVSQQTASFMPPPVPSWRANTNFGEFAHPFLDVDANFGVRGRRELRRSATEARPKLALYTKRRRHSPRYRCRFPPISEFCH